MKAIQDLADRIAQQFDPEKIILFGSYATGACGPDSDVDLLVVAAHDGKGWELAAEIRTRLRPTFPVDLMVRSPEELASRLRAGDVFLQEIDAHGLVLYEAQHA
jgi:predicted nucleotidyltransferase